MVELQHTIAAVWAGLWFAERLARPIGRLAGAAERVGAGDLNVRVKEKPDLREHASIGPAVAEVEEALKGSGRVVLRYSGTEPLARVMVEGNDAAEVRKHAESLVELIRGKLGA